LENKTPDFLARQEWHTGFIKWHKDDHFTEGQSRPDSPVLPASLANHSAGFG